MTIEDTWAPLHPALPVPPSVQKSRRCYICERDLPDAAFVADRWKASGFASRCRDCDNERARRYYEQNRERKQAYARERAARIREQQGGGKKLCRACGVVEVENSRRWYCQACRPKRLRQRERLRERRRVRATPTERGYGTAHKKLRKRWELVISEEVVFCARCGLEIRLGEPWDLGHDDLDRSRYSGPEHRSCNRATALHKVQRGVSREW